MSRLFLHIFPTDIITVSVKVFCESLQRQSVGADKDEAPQPTEDGDTAGSPAYQDELKTETLQALLHIKMS